MLSSYLRDENTEEKERDLGRSDNNIEGIRDLVYQSGQGTSKWDER